MFEITMTTYFLTTFQTTNRWEDSRNS